MIHLAARHCHLLFDVLLPVRCAACGLHGGEFCARCMRDLRNAPLLRRAARAGVPGVAALGPHDGPLRAAVLNVKFRNRVRAAEMLGELLGRKLACAGVTLVPVPLHERRLLERGFNQAEAIARGLAKASGLAVITDALVRTRATEPQRSLSLSRRGPNVSDAFALATPAASLRDRPIVLVDDVVTTGATLAACSRVLRAAGVPHVRAAAIAIKG